MLAPITQIIFSSGVSGIWIVWPLDLFILADMWSSYAIWYNLLVLKEARAALSIYVFAAFLKLLCI